MELQTDKRGGWLIVRATGRLDASWSEYFTDAFLTYIRQGEHHLELDAAGINFLSSAGIRSLVRIYKELTLINGGFRITNANDFVSKTLSTTGFGSWLSDDVPAEPSLAAEPDKEEKQDEDNIFELSEDAEVRLETINAWRPWQKVESDRIRIVAFPADSYALGIGSPRRKSSAEPQQYGDFASICGHLAYQSPETGSRPDYLLPVESYIPEMQTIQCLSGRGDMAFLYRFAPEKGKLAHSIPELARKALELSRSDISLFTVLAEIDGLVGAFLIHSPGSDEPAESGGAPLNGLRDRLSFCGERVYAREQALVLGIAGKSDAVKGHSLLVPLPSDPGLSTHIHAIVFPFQPLQNGRLDLGQQVAKFFNGPPPIALMHLIEDKRPAVGLGGSSFIRGALWCAPAKIKEETL